ncbi:MAG: putative quinol monooxygenase [Maricaulaceae bacterium]
MPKIKLTGYVSVPLDRREAVRARLAEHVKLTRAEPGCELFEVAFESSESDHLMVRERFTSRANFEDHQARAKNTIWADVTAGLERHYTIEEIE